MAKRGFQYNNNKKRPWVTVTKILGLLLCIIGLGLIGYYLYGEYINPPAPPAPPPPVTEPYSRPEPEPESEPEPIKQYQPYPVGKLILAEDREEYVDGDMMIYIPRLALETPILNGVEEATLERGLGLFNESQLPGNDGRNSNVSIAGHRDIHNMEFYYIDTLREGDKIYVTYEDNLYTYDYKETFVTDPYNWDPIRVQKDSVITLQSCTPIMVASNRIFVVGTLASVTPGGAFPKESDPPNTDPPPTSALDSTFPIV